MEVEMNKIELFDLPIDDGNLEETVEEILDRIQRDEVIEHVGVNSNKVVLSRRNAKIREIIQQADMVSADGYSVVRACHWLKKKKIDRVTGIDTMMELLKQAEALELTVYFLGTKEEILDRLLETIQQKYPRLIISGMQHGYFKQEEERAVVERIAACQPRMLFIGMTSPYKEEFVNKYKNELNANLIMGVGGSFDVLSGEISRAPAWMQRNGFEWLHRFMKEPRRLYKRYIFENLYFVYLTVQEKIK
ncbi:WecB/TagA/CpsF family glycosyltransferase [Enterococcus malodoratus]|nr:WecB/TagA/CpsF family glycosyltransferase [Enterococcus malodoratus]